MTKIIYLLSTQDKKAQKMFFKRGAKLDQLNNKSFKILTPLENDPFYSTQKPILPNLFSVVRIVTSSKEGFSTAENQIILDLREMLKELDIEYHTLIASEKVFKKTPIESINYMYFMKKRDDFTHTDYIKYYSNHHFRFGIKTNDITYIQNYINKEETSKMNHGIDNANLDFDSVSEMLFSSIKCFFSANDIQELGYQAKKDELKFVNREKSFMLCLRETNLS